MIKTNDVEFFVTSGEVMIEDATYCTCGECFFKNEKIKAKNGRWVSDMQDFFIYQDEDGEEVVNIGGFCVMHESYKRNKGMHRLCIHRETSVDSGCIGIFDANKWPKPMAQEYKKFYQAILDVTSFTDNSIKYGSVENMGFAAKTLHGDGGYNTVLCFNEHDELVYVECSFV